MPEKGSRGKGPPAEPEGDPSGGPETSLFGRLAVALDLVNPEQLADSLDLQRRLAQGGRSLPLGKIMLAKGYLTAFQIEEILTAQSRRAVRCGACGAEFAIREIVKPGGPSGKEAGAGPVRCPQCLRRLSDASVRAAGEGPDGAGEAARKEDESPAGSRAGEEAQAAGRKAPVEDRPSAEGPAARAEACPEARPEAGRPGPPATQPVIPSSVVDAARSGQQHGPDDAASRAVAKEPPPAPVFMLQVETKAGETRQVDLEPGTRLTIGRAPGIDGIEILDAALSRMHCMVSEDGGRLAIEDLGSRNGTYVNGDRIVRGVVRPGDEIEIGDSRVLVRLTRSRRSPVGNTTDIMRAEGLCSLCGVVIARQEVTSGRAQRTTAGILCPKCLEVALVPGRTLGGCRIIEQIGYGGMAEIYRAEQVSSGRIVALKTLIDPHNAAESTRKRFVVEARACARLEHPNLVRIYDTGEESGIPYIVMEFIEGDDLAALLDKRGFLPVEQSLDIVADIASVLAFAHSRGVIHRDVKPANILLDRVFNRARLVDLGVAKLIDQEGRDQRDGLTRAGIGLGTLEYASPEQIRSAKDVDARADIWALGATLYRMVVGARPFHAQNELGIAKAILYNPLAWPPEAAGRLPEELCRAVSKALEKNRENRYASADEFRERIARVRESLG